MRYELTAWVQHKESTDAPLILRCRQRADCELDARRLALEQAHATGMFIVSFIHVKQLKETPE